MSQSKPTCQNKNNDPVEVLDAAKLKDYVAANYKKQLFKGQMSYFFKPTDTLDPTKLKVTDVSLYSTASWQESELTAQLITEELSRQAGQTINPKDYVITDATANVGGNTLGFYWGG